MDKRKLSNVTSYFQVVKFPANVSANSEQLLGDDIVVNKSAIEIRVQDKPFHPNDSYVFHKRVFERQNRFCNLKWFKLYSWLDCNEISDSVTYFVCKRYYSKLKRNVEKSFRSVGYSDWEHALSSFDEYQDASYHRLAMTYEIIVPQCGDVKEMQNESATSQMKLNRRFFVKIV